MWIKLQRGSLTMLTGTQKMKFSAFIWISHQKTDSWLWVFWNCLYSRRLEHKYRRQTEWSRPFTNTDYRPVVNSRHGNWPVVHWTFGCNRKHKVRRATETETAVVLVKLNASFVWNVVTSAERQADILEQELTCRCQQQFVSYQTGD